MLKKTPGRALFVLCAGFALASGVSAQVSGQVPGPVQGVVPSRATPHARHGCSLPPDAPRWSDPSTWGGKLPVAGDSVTIPFGTTIVLDMSPPPLMDLLVDGQLVFGCTDIQLSVDRIAVTGTLRIGTAGQPDPHDVSIELAESYYGAQDPSARSLEVFEGGVLDMHGMPRAASWLHLAATAPAGANSIQLESPVDWKVGERIVLASTDFDFDQAEQHVISSVGAGGTLIGLQAPLAYTHWGQVETLGVDERAEVALLDRNIRIFGPASAPSADRGGQMRFLNPAGATRIRLSWVELTKMGEAGVLGRYPVHFHLFGDGAGSYVKSLSIHHCFNRSVTLHGTQNLLVQDTLSYETFGHAFFFEDGSETGNQLIGNLGLSTRRPTLVNQLVPSDANPATYWMQNTDNVLIGNVAAGSEDYGFWYDIPTSQNLSVPPVFEDNVAHSNGTNGFYKYDYLGLAIAAPPAEFLRFTAYKNRGRGISYRANDLQAVWREARLADNATAVFFASAGLQLDGQNRTVLQDSFVVGESGNIGTPQSSFELQYGRSLPKPNSPTNQLLGSEIYEGHVEVRDTIYANFQRASIGGFLREGAAFGQFRGGNFWAIDPRISVSGVQFQQAVPVYLEPAPNLAGGNASLLIHDQDGSLSGAPGQVVLADSDLLEPATGAFYDPDWNATIVPGIQAGNRFASLRLIDTMGVGTTTVTYTSLSRGGSLEIGSANGTAFPVNVLLPDDYLVRFETGPAPRDFSLQLLFGFPGSKTIVAVPYAAPRPTTVFIKGIPAIADADLATLITAPGTGFSYDLVSETLFIKLVLGGTGSTMMDGTRTKVSVVQ